MRRLRGKSPRPTRQLEWIVAAWTGPEVAAPEMVFNEPNVTSLIDGQDMVEHDDKFTVERIRGSFSFGQFADPAAGAIDAWPQVCWGIKVQETDEDGAIVVINPAQDITADSPWMWIESVVFPTRITSEGTNTQNDFILSHHVAVDIKSKRIMRSDDILTFTIYAGDTDQVWPAQGTTSNHRFRFNAHLRVLVKLT